MVERHMAGCRTCAAEVEAFQGVNSLLDLWQTGSAPGDLLGGVMAELTRDATQASSETGARSIHRRGFYPDSGFWLGVLRDLVAAAAVSLAVYWSAGAWLDDQQVAAAGKSVNGATAAYTRAVETVVDHAAGAAGNYTRKIFIEEWE
jgi:hypothetical protein